MHWKAWEYWEFGAFAANMLASILLILASLIPLDGKVKDNRRNGVLRKFTPRGKILLIVCCIASIMPAIQYLASKKIEALKDEEKNLEELSLSQKTRRREKRAIALNKIRLEENERRVIDNFTTSLAKFGLKSDSISGKIDRIANDSSKFTPIADLGFCVPDGLQIDTLDNGLVKITYSICNRLAVSKEVNLHIYFAYDIAGTIFYQLNPSKNYKATSDLYLGKDQSIFNSFSTETEGIKTVFCLLDGSFKDISGKLHKLRQLVLYNVAEKNFGSISDQNGFYTYEQIKSGFLTSGNYPLLKP